MVTTGIVQSVVVVPEQLTVHLTDGRTLEFALSRQSRQGNYTNSATDRGIFVRPNNTELGFYDRLFFAFPPRECVE